MAPTASWHVPVRMVASVTTWMATAPAGSAGLEDPVRKVISSFNGSGFVHSVWGLQCSQIPTDKNSFRIAPN